MTHKCSKLQQWKFSKLICCHNSYHKANFHHDIRFYRETSVTLKHWKHQNTNSSYTSLIHFHLRRATSERRILFGQPRQKTPSAIFQIFLNAINAKSSEKTKKQLKTKANSSMRLVRLFETLSIYFSKFCIDKRGLTNFNLNFLIQRCSHTSHIQEI